MYAYTVQRRLKSSTDWNPAQASVIPHRHAVNVHPTTQAIEQTCEGAGRAVGQELAARLILQPLRYIVTMCVTRPTNPRGLPEHEHNQRKANDQEGNGR